MAVSGSNNFTLTRNQVIYEALYHIGAYSVDDVIPANVVSQVGRRLNTMMLAWKNEGIHLWNVRRSTTKLVGGQAEHTLTSLAPITSGTVSVTSLSAALTFSSAPRIDCDGWTFQVSGDTVTYTISAHTAGSTTATLSAIYAGTTNATATYTLTSDEATDEADALDIDEAYIYDTATDSDYPPLTRLVRHEYMALPDKTTSGMPTHYFVEYTRSGLKATLWPVPASTTYTYQLKWTNMARLDDLDASTDTPDVPEQWLEAMILNLAYAVSFSFGFQGSAEQLKRDAVEAKTAAMSDSSDRAAMTIIPDLRR